MDVETLSKFALYMSVEGNKPELFGDSEYIPKYITNRPEGYEIPPSAMEDETFAAVITEAEKYLGYPYGATCSQLKRLGTCPMIGGEKKDR